MMVPNVGSWIITRNIKGSLGKVVVLSTDSKTCKAIFLNQPVNRADNSKGAAVEVQFEDIATTINDKAKVDALNKELARMANG